MKLKGILLYSLFSLTLLASCGDNNKEAQENATERLKVEKEKMSETLKKREDSLLQVKEARIRKESITQDSLRQVKEHGHAH